MKRTILLVLVLALGLAAKVANADFTFGEPTNLGPIVNSADGDAGPSISADRLTLYFSSQRSGGSGLSDLWLTTRETIDDDWGEPVNLGPIVNSSSHDGGPSISADGLLLYFYSDRPGGYSPKYFLWPVDRSRPQYFQAFLVFPAFAFFCLSNPTSAFPDVAAKQKGWLV